MGIDAVALLRIPNLVPPRTSFGIDFHVEHRADCSLLYTMDRFDGTAADEHAMQLRGVLGDTLDEHTDERGILFFPDVCEPRGASYEAIVAELRGAGVWAPKVSVDHVPSRFTAATPGSHESVVAELITAVGRDTALEIDSNAEMNFLVMQADPGRADAVADYAAQINRLREALGEAFVTRYEASLRGKLAHAREQQQTSMDRQAVLSDRMARGEPLVSQSELGAFIADGRATAILEGLDPSLTKDLEEELESVDVDALPENDLARMLAGALRGRKKS
ncbi:MAG TPA: hypothetical protein VM925_35140 [Labilithrix sp.]|nr:hypothetical protein [Labilithrix sp.]